ncbi:SMP-30/gluconolactonase/LRE family protein [Maritalea mobilis]|nr:SMP-30/gluconolactonase/LRE family protein [Maritalea mobilis]
MMSQEIQCVVPAGDKTGEGAVWSAEEQAVYWCDINRFLVHRYDEKTQSTQSWLFDEPVVAVSLTSEAGRFLLALASKLIWWWPETDRREDHGFKLKGFPQVRLNDGRADPLGNFWVGSMKNNVLPDGELGDAGPGEGVLFRITPSGEVTEWRDNLGISNTLCWSPDHTKFYFGDTLENQIYAYDYDKADGSISNERVFFDGFDRGGPDGSAMDAEGYLWNCRFGGDCIVRVAPDGAIDRLIEMPISNVTTCTFGGADLQTLYITSASILCPPGQRLAGSLFSLRVDEKGMAENRFKVQA